MTTKKCQWILPQGNKCRQPIEGDVPRKSILTDGTKLYLCKKHRNSKNCKGYYYNNTEVQKKKKKDYNKTDKGKLVIKKINKKKYFSRTGHPYYIWNAAKKHWSIELGQKFNLKYRELKGTQLNNYNLLYDDWAESDFLERLTPMITKIHFKQPYSKNNFMWVTFEVAGYNPGYMKEVMQEAKNYQDRLTQTTLELGGISTEDEIL